MKRYEFFEHTADAKFRAYGKTMEEAFSNAALAMYSIITDTEKIQKKIHKEIQAKGHDLKSLLYSFLEELLFLLDTENFLLHKTSKVSIHKKEENYLLEATVIGDECIDEYSTHGDIKAVTYNQMDIKEEKDKIILQVVMDL